MDLAFASKVRSYKAAGSLQASSDVFLSGFTPLAFLLKGKSQGSDAIFNIITNLSKIFH